MKIYGREEEEEMASRTQADGEWVSPPLKKKRGRIDSGQRDL